MDVVGAGRPFGIRDVAAGAQTLTIMAEPGSTGINSKARPGGWPPLVNHPTYGS
jgi:hypothetical protein